MKWEHKVATAAPIIPTLEIRIKFKPTFVTNDLLQVDFRYVTLPVYTCN